MQRRKRGREQRARGGCTPREMSEHREAPPVRTGTRRARCTQAAGGSGGDETARLTTRNGCCIRGLAPATDHGFLSQRARCFSVSSRPTWCCPFTLARGAIACLPAMPPKTAKRPSRVLEPGEEKTREFLDVLAEAAKFNTSSSSSAPASAAASSSAAAASSSGPTSSPEPASKRRKTAAAKVGTAADRLAAASMVASAALTAASTTSPGSSSSSALNAAATAAAAALMVSGGDELRRRYACDQCGYRSSRAGDMTKHINGGVLFCATEPFCFARF
jgi:hypothetical protein